MAHVVAFTDCDAASTEIDASSKCNESLAKMGPERVV
jgi:hypothetical protein